MYSKEIIDLMKKLFYSGQSIQTIYENLMMPYTTIDYMVKNNYNRNKLKPGPRNKLNSHMETKIKREISILKSKNERVTASKLKYNMQLVVNERTIQRKLKAMKLIYKNVVKSVPLSKFHKECRIKLATQWIETNHPWQRTVFSNEKRFSLDGSDNLGTWTKSEHDDIRIKRQMGGGGLMVWGMLLPNGILHLERLDGRVNGETYNKLLSEKVKPFAGQHVTRNNYYFQQDNASIHRCKIVMTWFEDSKMSLIEWPPRSPDINLIENVWKMLSDIVYVQEQFQNKEDL